MTKKDNKFEKKKKDSVSGTHELYQITGVLQKAEDDFERFFFFFLSLFCVSVFSIFFDHLYSSLLIRAGMASQKAKISPLNQLVIALTAPESHDLNFVRVFFVVYPSLTPSDRLLATLIQRYRVPSGLMPQHSLDAIQARFSLLLS